MRQIDERHQSLYTEEAEEYDRRRFASRRGKLYDYYERHALTRLLSPLDGARVLDVPAGTGRITEELIRNGSNVVAADLTPAMLYVARDRVLTALRQPVPPADFQAVCANGRQLPFPDDSFDRVISIRFLHLIPPREWSGFLSEMGRVIKPDGRVVVQLFNPLYGGPLALVRELYRHARGEPGEQFVWPHQIKSIFAAVNLEVDSVTSYWLPGMGFLGRPGSPGLDFLARACESTPLRWIAGPHHVLARTRPV